MHNILRSGYFIYKEMFLKCSKNVTGIIAHEYFANAEIGEIAFTIFHLHYTKEYNIIKRTYSSKNDRQKIHPRS